MACHRISKLILLPLLLASLSGCQIGDSPSLSDSSVAKADRYDSPGVSVASLEAEGCMIFEDMYFARGEEKDHVFRFKGNEITEHVTCPKTKFDAKNFDGVIGEPLFGVIQRIGIPHFRGKEATSSVTYLCKDGIERSLSLTLNNESRWMDNAVEEKNIHYYLRDYVDEGSTYKPSLERCKSIKIGMYLSDVFFMLGRPHKFSDPNGMACCWAISSGGTFHIYSGQEREGTTAFFDSSILERDDYSPILQSTNARYYWSVERLSFNEHDIEEYPNINYIN